MNIFDRFNRVPEQDCTQPQPKRGVELFFFLLQNNFGKIFTLNLLFVFFSIPIVTIPAAFCAMYRVCVELVRKGHCFLWQDFWKEFKSQLIKSFPMGLLFGVQLFASYYFLSLCISNSGLFALACGALGVLLLVMVAVEGNYSFVMLAMLQLKNTDILKNAGALTGLEPKKDVILIGLFMLFLSFLLLLLPYSLILTPFFFYSPYALAVTTVVNEAVQTHIVEPFEERSDT